jgi:tetratricopeptide (TPR) repeat protein
MHLTRSRPYSATCLALCIVLTAVTAGAQPSLSFEIKKPQKYEARTFPSEKSTYTKFSWPKRFYNNMVSRFNYYFNANNIMSEVIAASKDAHIDDYTQLLPFYNYELSESYKDRMDTVIYKATAGIVLHDLRSDWVDKLYLMMGKAYLLRKDFDSATSVFQYINYAFAPKDGGYDMPIGSNASNTEGVFTIATRESKSAWKKITGFPPSRNESFLWQIRTYIEQDALIEASSLLEIIRVDPNFPERLRTDLEELTAYLLYKQKNYSDAADHLVKALDNAETKLETARWEYLAGQLYELGHSDSKAIAMYERAIQHTTDPLMEVHARLNEVSLAAGTQENSLQKNLDELLRMAKKDKYETQRDVIYYAAAQLELKRKNYDAAQALLLTSLKYNIDNVPQKQLSLLLLGDLNYARKSYMPSYRFYDSIQTDQLKDIDRERVTGRKPALQVISQNQSTISTEDSLQKLAAMGVDERDASIEKLLRRLRKEKGLKDMPNDPASFSSASAAPVDLFARPTAEFYFHNSSLRSRGLGEFTSRWGNRPNVDNWRRRNAIDRTMTTATATPDANTAGIKPEEDLTAEALLKNIPLTAEQIGQSNQAIIKALLDNAHTFQNRLEDYASAIEMYEELLRRYPETAEVEDALYNLAFAYGKNGQPEKADAASAQLKRTFPNGKLTTQLASEKKDKRNNDPARQTYESVYGLFLAGKWKEAEQAKLAADQKFGKNYWTPQLLYIESIYYIKQKEDSTAINRLQNITSLFANSPLAEKAATMIDVLKRRKEIEQYLTNLDVNRPEDARSRAVDLNNTNTQVINAKRPDSAFATPKEIKTATKDLVNIANTNTVDIPAVSKKDSMAVVGPKEISAKGIVQEDTKPKTISSNGFNFTLTDTLFVIVVLDKVDPIFVTEARNAFNRFNQERYSSAQIGIYNHKLNDQYHFLMLGPFNSAAEAIGYIDKVKPLAGSRIVPWLAADKFSFSMISNANMAVLTGNQDLTAYRNFLHGIFPDKF